MPKRLRKYEEEEKEDQKSREGILALVFQAEQDLQNAKEEGEQMTNEKFTRWIATICLLFFLWRGDPWAMKLLITLGIINSELVNWLIKK